MMNFLCPWLTTPEVNLSVRGLHGSGRRTLLYAIANNGHPKRTQREPEDEWPHYPECRFCEGMVNFTVRIGEWQEADCVMYVLDLSSSSDHTFVKDQLCSLQLSTNKPIAVVCNKADLPDAISEEKLNRILCLHANKHIKVFMCSALELQGYHEPGEWLSAFFRK